jgi:CDP-glucose 4,6-dehydratase
MIDERFWKGKKVFITGHTGFKGSWLCLLLDRLGAEVAGYSLSPPTSPSLFDLGRISSLVEDTRGDVRDGDSLERALRGSGAEVVFHLAAQPLVRESYIDPVGTFDTNVMGTIKLLDAARHSENVQAVVVVTTDKCYQNNEWTWGYREIDRLGGRDPYSCSKACAELATAAYRDSFFADGARPRVATARAGNVIGGGDWAKDRLIPDCIRALEAGDPVRIRNPNSIRPWQHVLEPLSGYLMLAERLYADEGRNFVSAWNFGPADEDARPVSWIVRSMCELWGDGASSTIDDGPHPHEAAFLKLDCSKSHVSLGWHPVWDLRRTLESIVAWHKASSAREATLEDISAWLASAI